MGIIKHQGDRKIELCGVYGDVFDPKARNDNVEVDLVPITCVIDPIYIVKDTIIWENNVMLRSALGHTFTDTLMFQKTVHELIVTMSENGSLIQHFLDYKSEKDDYNLRKLTHVYIWDVPRTSAYFKKSRILTFAALPIFTPTYLASDYPLSEIHSRLRKNLSISIKSLLDQLRIRNNPEITSIAFAAFVGSSHRLDSPYYLSYQESFFAIHKALTDSDIPFWISRIYLVAWDKLSRKERVRALEGLFVLYRYRNFYDFPYFRLQPIADYMTRALLWIIVFSVSYVLRHPNRRILFGKLRESKGERTTFIINTLPILGFFNLILAVLYNEFLLRILEMSFFLFIIGEIFFAFLIYKATVYVAGK
jgi:hypothetical protein